MAFFNFFGQSISRTLLVKGISDAESSVIVTALERVFSLAVLVIASISAAFFVLGKVSFDYAPGVMLLSMILFVVLSMGIFYIFFLKKRQKSELKLVFSSGFGRGFVAIILIIVLMHTLMLGAYLSLIVGMAGLKVLTAKAVFAALLTMLGASFPISFGGWGVREVSAGFAFRAANISSALGVGAGIGVGLLTLVALALNFCVVWVLKGLAPEKKDLSVHVEASSGYSRRLILLLSWVVAPVVLVLMMVQLPVPISAGKLTVNLADPLAIVAGMTFVFVVIQRRSWRSIWSNAGVNWWLFGSAFVIAISYLIGYFDFGYLAWALYNRLLGVGILFSYIIVGAFLTALWGEFGARAAAKSVGSALIVIIVFEWFLRVNFDQTVLMSLNWASPRWAGFLANPNSYAFFLLSVLPLPFLFLGSNSSAGMRAWKEALVPGMFFAVIYLTASRAAFGSAAFFAVMFFAVNKKKTLQALVCAVLCVLFLYGATDLLNIISGFGLGRGDIVARPNDFAIVQNDRIISMIEGWKMFVAHPIFGAGLGAFYKSQSELALPLAERALIIHNSFLWILAEAGLFGFTVIFLPPLILGVRTFWGMKWRTDPYLCGFLLLLGNAAIMGMAHELMYQRVFWLMLGIFLARPFVMRKQVNQLSHS
ncbi:hypothetical protein TMES_19815 [Thalassospira mesophila]|uniref:O-antigen ligase-related domain-containing protein n=2 Tax=Thalassospira mesophila TaxID=1293891 RepID=A0A1Y2KVI3_9PROT|nr:hypothetical protein TMES_19815 [Thalassospira mesophila]